MAEVEPQTAQPKREFLAIAAPWAETLSKAVAGMVIALYASGFLIVSLYHSRFGFLATNPFRPRVLAAGAWFFFFTGIPVSLVAGLRTYSALKIVRNLLGMYIACYVLSAVIGQLLFEFSSTPSTTHMSTWLSVTLAIVGLAVVVAAYHPKVPLWIAITASVLSAAYFMVDTLHRLFSKHEFGVQTLATWFFICSVVAIWEFKTRNRKDLAWEVKTANRQEVFTWGGLSEPVGVLFAALLAFALYVYPNLKASWGGGTPANVTVYFTKDSLLSPNKSVQAQLIEESDEGFYIVGPKESKAVFVPRSAVALVYFSDKATESPMLQGIK